MPNPYFRFKQFTIRHDRCAMKVGTDGVILGATAGHSHPKNILDIGTGTGLVALMLAQRFSDAQIDGIEIDTDASQQASENVTASPFSARIHINNCSLQEFTTEKHYDLIVCNPPFFKVSSTSPSETRNTARQTGLLEPADIFRFADQHLDHEGVLVIIFPAETHLAPEAEQFNLYPQHQLRVKGNSTADVKRIVWTFGKTQGSPIMETLVLEESRNQYTPQFTQLVKDFYLYL